MHYGYNILSWWRFYASVMQMVEKLCKFEAGNKICFPHTDRFGLTKIILKINTNYKEHVVRREKKSCESYYKEKCVELS